MIWFGLAFWLAVITVLLLAVRGGTRSDRP